MTDVDAARRFLTRLADASPDTAIAESPPALPDENTAYRETIERATDAIDDVESAASFVEAVGLDELERAAERADRSVSAHADEGRRALATFHEFQTVAAGDHFHRPHGTSLGGGDIGSFK